MKFRLRPEAQTHDAMAYDVFNEQDQQTINDEIVKHVGEYRGRAVRSLNVDGTGTVSRCKFIDPDMFSRALCHNLDGVANLNNASISIPSRESQEQARIIFAKEESGTLSEIEKNEIHDTTREYAAGLIYLDDPKGIIIGRNTTEVIGLSYYLAGVDTGSLVLSDAENASIYTAFQNNRDNGNPYKKYMYASYPTWYSARGPKYPPMQETKRDNHVARFYLENDLSERKLCRSLVEAIDADTKLLFFSHVVRSTGNEVPVAKIANWARKIKSEKNPREPDIFIVIDGTQAVGNLPKVDFKETGADAYAYSTYKTLGTSPIGFLAVDTNNPKTIERMKQCQELNPQDEQIVLNGMFDRRLGIEGNVDDSLSYADLAAFNEKMHHIQQDKTDIGDFSDLEIYRAGLRKYFSKKLGELNSELARRGMYIDHNRKYGGGPGDVDITYSTLEKLWNLLRGGGGHVSDITDTRREDPRAARANAYWDAVVAEVDVSKPTSFILSFFFRGALTFGREAQIWEKLAKSGVFCSCIAFDRYSDQPSVFRISFGANTSEAEIDIFFNSLRDILFEQRELNYHERQRKNRNEHLAMLRPEERDWRIYPGDGADPSEISDTAYKRAINLDDDKKKMLESMYSVENGGILDYRNYWGNVEAEQAALEQVKYFPVLLISAPHIDSEVQASFPGEPTPLLYATALLDRYLRIDEFPSKKRVPKITSVMNPPVYNTQFEQHLTEHILEYRPRVIGISNIAEGHEIALRIAKLVKQHSPDSIVLFGGSHEDNTHPSGYKRVAEQAREGTLKGNNADMFNLDEDALKKIETLRTLAKPDEREWVDFVMSGDGTYGIVKFLTVIADHPGKTIRQIKEIFIQEKEGIAQVQGSGHLSYFDEESRSIIDLPFSGTPVERDRLPFIDRRRLSHENRFPIFNYKKTAQVMASVGCKYACEFCCESADSILQGVAKVQSRTPEHVFKELTILSQQGYEAVFFDDSTFNQRRNETNRILDMIIEGELKLEWGCQTTIDDVPEDVLQKMAAAGCTYIYFGLEQSSATAQGIQKAQKQKFQNLLPIVTDADVTSDTKWIENFKRVALHCKKYGIRVGTSLQFGLGESLQDRKDTIDTLAALTKVGVIPEHCISLNINATYPGTVQFLRQAKEGKSLPDYRERLNRDSRFETAHQFGSLNPEECEEIYSYAKQKLGNALV